MSLQRRTRRRALRATNEEILWEARLGLATINNQLTKMGEGWAADFAELRALMAGPGTTQPADPGPATVSSQKAAPATEHTADLTTQDDPGFPEPVDTRGQEKLYSPPALAHWAANRT